VFKIARTSTSLQLQEYSHSTSNSDYQHNQGAMNNPFTNIQQQEQVANWPKPQRFANAAAIYAGRVHWLHTRVQW